jgi:hypothetical protein
MMIWGTPISGLQFFGYAIALCGMVYYKLGLDALKGYAAEGLRHWAEFGNTRPVLRKVIVIAGGLFFIFVLFGGFAPSYATPYVTEVASKYGWSS